MRLTKHTDYALRVLIFVACQPDRWVSTEEIAAAFGVSVNHLVKVVSRLAHLGYLSVRRGRAGGVALGRAPETIRLGRLIRETEPDLNLVECFDRESNECPLGSSCALIAPLAAAREAFFRELDTHTLADVVPPRKRTKYLKALNVVT